MTQEKVKSITLNELIKSLQELKKELKEKHGVSKPGNVRLFMSVDPEGNHFNSINKDDMFGYEKDTEQGEVITLWPWEEYVEL